MNIIRKYPETLTMKQLYDLTKSPEIKRMSSNQGEEIEIDAFIEYEDVKADGTISTIVSIKDKTGETFATNSPTFTSDFDSIVEMCTSAGEQLHTIKVSGGRSKAGRNFITCVYID